MTATAFAAAFLSACAVGPDHVRPTAPVPVAYKEATIEAGATWLPAAPADALDRGDWWRLFGDAELSRLAERIDPQNQDVAAALAAYRQATALVREQRAALFPTLGVGASAQRIGGRRSSDSGAFGLSLDADWAPDLWGRIGRAVEAARAREDISVADLGAARLSAQAALAAAYFSLREADAEAELLARTIEGYERSLQIVQNRYAVGVIARTDVLQAETQLANTRAERAALRADRARFEHAIAVLIGLAPAAFSLAEAPWRQDVPAVPPGVPSTLLERRPDIAAAERQVAVANAQIGIERSAYFPSLTLGASIGTAGLRVAELFNASTLLWSFGVSVAQSLFDAGARQARVEGAEAAHAVTVARYRQTVLLAFQAVEDQLANARALAEQQELRRQASVAADLSEVQVLNRYRAGQVGYSEVVVAQATALVTRRSLIRIGVERQLSAIALIQALGGGWNAADPPLR